MLEHINYYRRDLNFTRLPSNCIFCFGSNMQGYHGKGAALTAIEYFGAIAGQPRGLQGQSYAIPTRHRPGKTLPLSQIEQEVNTFLDFATSAFSRLNFLITPIGTGYAGYHDSQIAPLFAERLPTNCCVSQYWLDYIAHANAHDISGLL